MKTTLFALTHPSMSMATDPDEARYENAWGPTRIELPEAARQSVLRAWAAAIVISTVAIAVAAHCVARLSARR